MFATGNFAGRRASCRCREFVRRLQGDLLPHDRRRVPHIEEPEMRSWLQERMESTRNRSRSTTTSRSQILTKLTDAEIFEQFIHTNYVGAKRFSLEGAESMIPLLDLLDRARRRARRRGDRHRHGPPRPPERAREHHGQERRARSSPRSKTSNPERYLGRGDVKYHLGYSTDRVTRVGRRRSTSRSRSTRATSSS